MKVELNFKIVFIAIIFFIIIFFISCFISSVKPNEYKFDFKNVINTNDCIKNYRIEENNNRKCIYFETNSEIFKEYSYHSYISGDAIGRKIKLEIILIPKDKDTYYKIKSYCYDYANLENIKFVGQYYNWFVKENKRYNLAIYVNETDTLYITDIEL